MTTPAEKRAAERVPRVRVLVAVDGEVRLSVDLARLGNVEESGPAWQLVAEIRTALPRRYRGK